MPQSPSINGGSLVVSLAPDGSFIVARNDARGIPPVKITGGNLAEVQRVVDFLNAPTPNVAAALNNYRNGNHGVNIILDNTNTVAAGYAIWNNPGVVTNEGFVQQPIVPRAATLPSSSSFFDISIKLERADFYSPNNMGNAAAFSQSSFFWTLIHEIIHPYAGGHIWANNMLPDAASASVDPTSIMAFSDYSDKGLTFLGLSLADQKNPQKVGLALERNYQNTFGVSGTPNLALLYNPNYRKMSDPTYVAASSFGSMFGSTLGRFIAGNDSLLQVASSSVLGAIGANIGQFITTHGLSGVVKNAQGIVVSVLDDFGQELVSGLQGSAVGAFSSLLALEFGNVLGVDGFGGELLTTAASSVIGQVANNAINLAAHGTVASGLSGNAAHNLFHGLNGSDLFGTVDKSTGLVQGGLISGAVGSFFGQKLGSLILAPNNTEGALLSSLGATAGVWALTAGATSLGIGSFAASLTTAFTSVFSGLAGVAVPFVGSLVGFLLGSLIGRLFGARKPRVPTASAEIYLDSPSGYWQTGQVLSQNGGNYALVSNMAQAARDGINGVVSVLLGGADTANVANTLQARQKYGHSGQTIYFDEFNGSSWVRRYSGAAADAAVEVGLLAGIQSTKVAGGNILQKRALYGVASQNIATVLGNLQVAEDYTKYLTNTEFVNKLILDNPNSAFTASWAITLLRAEELELDEFKPSDLYGGLGGFATSFGYGTGGAGFESLSIAFEGAGLRVTDLTGRSAFSMLAAFNNEPSPIAGTSALITNFGSNVGYTPWTGQATAGNDIWIAVGGGPVIMDDTGYVEEWRWNPWDYTYEPYYTYVSGGDDIFVGSDFGDSLYGQAGWDWLDGGAGNDLIDGGDNNDVLLGRSGNDRMLGGIGNDYLAGGDGDDYFYDGSQNWGLYGGDGDDILVGGAGSDALYGENGDDVFIVDQDGGGTWDALTGMGGSDTLSYERFTSGVYVDFANLGGWAWDPTAKYIYGDAIAGSMENVTGSSFADTIFGDASSNILTGGAGNDYLAGRDGDDIVIGGEGIDTLVGGNGSDTASYVSSSSGVIVKLESGFGYGGDASGDIFQEIENVTGSAFNDELTGSVNNNILSGGEGDDRFVLTDGSDVIDGGSGLDTIDSARSASAVTIYYDEGTYDPYYGYYTPGAGWIASAGNGTTSFASIEGFVGSAFADSISGSGGDEVFEGGAGNDYLVGAGGSDTFVFGRGGGQDTVYSSSAGASAIVLKEDINWRDVSIAGANYGQQYGSLTVAIRGTSDQMTVGSNFYYVNSGNSAGQHSHAIKSLNLSGVSTVDIDMIDWTPYAADENSTVVYGAQNRADLIFAYGGSDTIYTASGGYESRGNVVYAGDGNDTIYSTAGDDQFIFERGNGVDTLTDHGGADTIVMGPSVAADDVIYEVVGADLYIGIRDANNPNTVASQVADRIRVVDGGTKTINANYGYETLNTIEHVRVGGQEIDLTKANINWTVAYDYSGGYYPIALDLDGDGIELRSVEGSRIASVRADGTVTRMGWLGQDDGFLALDRDGNGLIDRVGEISFIGDKEGAKTDLEGLTAYDSNADGKLDASDKRWGEFKVWQDKNQDGLGTKEELVDLDKAGITSISLQGQATGFTRADGPDNTVIATTEVSWADKARTGSAYDVMLAWKQVRTDGGDKALVATDVLARGVQVDDIEARLHGTQSLTEDQAKAIREKTGQAKGLGEGGLLYRIEDLLGAASTKPGNLGLTPLAEGTAAVATVATDGLLSIDPALASRIAEGSRTLGLIDRYADSDWTRLGSIAPGKADMRGAVAVVEKRDLAIEQKAVIADARKIVGERKLAEEVQAATLAAKDAADAVAQPAPIPPTAAELERLKHLDKFRLLEGASESAAADDDTADIDAEAAVRDLVRQLGAADEPKTADQIATVPYPIEDGSIGEETISDAPAPVPTEASPGRPTMSEERPQDADAAVSDTNVYGVIIRTANPRLVQALASFGDAPAMMASYQGLNVANDAQAAWLSVDAMPSVQRLAAIR